MACVDPATLTRTQSAGDPSRLRYVTAKTIVVLVVPLPGDTEAPDRRVGPAAADAGATRARTSTMATPHTPRVARMACVRAPSPGTSPARERARTTGEG